MAVLEKLIVATLDVLSDREIVCFTHELLLFCICVLKSSVFKYVILSDREIVCFKPELLLFWCAYGLYIIR